MKINKIVLDSVNSTNKYCKDNIDKLSSFDIVIANEQTSGYGRFNRNWHQEKGNSIALSLVYKSNINLAEVGRFSIVTSVSILNVLLKYIDNVAVKWPNDILINDKKVCGILVETLNCDGLTNLIIGVGLNVNNTDFKNDLSNIATSLFIEKKKMTNIDLITDEIILEMFNNITNISQNYSSLHQKYIDYSVVLGRKIQFKGKCYKIINILENGHIQGIGANNEIINISSGEISLS